MSILDLDIYVLTNIAQFLFSRDVIGYPVSMDEVLRTHRNSEQRLHCDFSAAKEVYSDYKPMRDLVMLSRTCRYMHDIVSRVIEAFSRKLIVVVPLDSISCERRDFEMMRHHRDEWYYGLTQRVISLDHMSSRDRPVILAHVETVYAIDGQYHRIGGPAVERGDGSREWWRNGKLHREDGPAIEDADGTREWWTDGIRYKKDGPTVIRGDGTREWWELCGRHRKDGPAVERADGTREWWLRGERYDDNVEPTRDEDVEIMCDMQSLPFEPMDGTLLEAYDFTNFDDLWTSYSYSNKELLMNYDLIHREVPGPPCGSYTFETEDGTRAWVRYDYVPEKTHTDDGRTMNTVRHLADISRVGRTNRRYGWYIRDELHREDGPAIEYADGRREWYIRCEFHREDGPAIERADGTREWYIHGEAHREDGPAIEYATGRREWYIHGKLHRENGPAIESPIEPPVTYGKRCGRLGYKVYNILANGVRSWYYHGKLHREDGPATEWADGTRAWYIHGKLHRDDGPAIIWACGVREWWYNGFRHRVVGPATVQTIGQREWYYQGARFRIGHYDMRKLIELCPAVILREDI